jgi:hypothetical protein
VWIVRDYFPFLLGYSRSLVLTSCIRRNFCRENRSSGIHYRQNSVISANLSHFNQKFLDNC